MYFTHRDWFLSKWFHKTGPVPLRSFVFLMHCTPKIDNNSSASLYRNTFRGFNLLVSFSFTPYTRTSFFTEKLSCIALQLVNLSKKKNLRCTKQIQLVKKKWWSKFARLPGVLQCTIQQRCTQGSGRNAGFEVIWKSF